MTKLRKKMEKNYKTPDFPTRLRNIRKALGQTQADLADKMGIPRTSWANYENGTSIPPGDFISALKFMFSVNLDWFLTGEGEMFLSIQATVSVGTLIDQRLAKIEAKIAELENNIIKNSPDSDLFVSEPEPEYCEEQEDVTFVEGIAAGKPIFQSEARSTFPVSKRYIKTRPEDYYVGRIEGTSMIAAGIPDGVLVLIRVSDAPKDGAIQVVECQGEATLKRMREIPGKGWQICFDDFTGRYIEIGPADDFYIQGDFIAVLPEGPAVSP